MTRTCRHFVLVLVPVFLALLALGAFLTDAQAAPPPREITPAFWISKQLIIA